MAIFLDAGGGPGRSSATARAFASEMKGAKRVLHIPVAMPESGPMYGECYNWAKSALQRLGAGPIDMWADLEKRKLSDLSRYQAIYFMGGNTFLLRSILRRSGFDRLVARYVAGGRPVYGVSAGAIVFGKTIRSAFLGDPDDNDIGLKDLRGMGMAGRYSVHVHYERRDDRQVLRFVARTGNEVIALPNGSGVRISGGIATVLGSPGIAVFGKRGKSVMKRGATLPL